jgi:starch synthase
VSPNYAREILTPEYGAGLDFLLRERQGDLVGILNGIDTKLWNPSKDLIIPKQYSFEDFKHGKFLNKRELRKEFGLAQDDYKPIFSMAVRLTEQKGVNMLSECIEPVLQTMHCQFAIMGNGDPRVQDYFASLPHKYPGQVAVKIGFDQETEHLMDAGSDFSLVPSIYEPCGLKQMVSQTYGALPVGRSTGGLEDTILNYNESYGLGTGFKFNDISSRALYNTIGWANTTYYDRPEHIDSMRKMAMKQNYSWARSSGDYKNLYQTMSGVY